MLAIHVICSAQFHTFVSVTFFVGDSAPYQICARIVYHLLQNPTTTHAQNPNLIENAQNLIFTEKFFLKSESRLLFLKCPQDFARTVPPPSSKNVICMTPTERRKVNRDRLAIARKEEVDISFCSVGSLCGRSVLKTQLSGGNLNLNNIPPYFLRKQELQMSLSVIEDVRLARER